MTAEARNDEPSEASGVPAALDDLIDEALMGSFPASDPPSFWGRESFSADREGEKEAR